MRIEEIVWLEEIVEKLWRKHAVETDEVSDVLGSRPKFFFVEKGHRPDENLYLALGRTEAGRFLAVYFIYKPTRQALIVSSRDMTAAERKRYERS
ncbi:MAG: BrnT family toxin [Thermoanaerobaculia bacterium]